MTAIQSVEQIPRVGHEVEALVESFPVHYRYGREPLPRAKPEEQLTRGMRVEDFFGICAEELDDEFIESLREIRRGVWQKESRS
jgi:hypothetical protein